MCVLEIAKLKKTKSENGKNDAYKYIHLSEFFLHSRKGGQQNELKLLIEAQLTLHLDLFWLESYHFVLGAG